MGCALAVGMDAVMFHAKGVHLAAQRVGRRLLRGFGLTPARFDLMHAVGSKGMKQSDIWRRLNVVRSVVCEMLHALRALGWVKRVRAPDGRTWLVMLTRLGRGVYERIYAARVGNGDAAVHMDAGITHGHVELEAEKIRAEIVLQWRGFEAMYRTSAPYRGPDLYPWNPEDYFFWLADPRDPEADTDVPFVT